MCLVMESSLVSVGLEQFPCLDRGSGFYFVMEWRDRIG
jgi:hypothetical protein